MKVSAALFALNGSLVQQVLSVIYTSDAENTDSIKGTQ